MPPYYDSMVAKLIVNGTTRNECLMRLRRSLEEFVIGGIDTTIPLHQRIIGEQAFIDGDYDIHWLEKLVGLQEERMIVPQSCLFDFPGKLLSAPNPARPRAHVPTKR